MMTSNSYHLSVAALIIPLFESSYYPNFPDESGGSRSFCCEFNFSFSFSCDSWWFHTFSIFCLICFRLSDFEIFLLLWLSDSVIRQSQTEGKYFIYHAIHEDTFLPGNLHSNCSLVKQGFIQQGLQIVLTAGEHFSNRICNIYIESRGD